MTSRMAICEALRAAAPVVGPSLLAADFANLERETHALEQAGARMLHLDVMDGHLVPNISFGIPIVEAVRRVTHLPLDVHLMISEPDRYVERFREAGADLLTIHIEAVPEPARLLETIRGLGAAAGLSLNPPTPLSMVEPALPYCDLVLTMSVMPGFGGQGFQAVALDKLRGLRQRVDPGVLLSVDGGVNAQTIRACSEAGADLFIVGTALLDHDDYRQRLGELTSEARKGRSVQD